MLEFISPQEIVATKTVHHNFCELSWAIWKRIKSRGMNGANPVSLSALPSSYSSLNLTQYTSIQVATFVLSYLINHFTPVNACFMSLLFFNMLISPLWAIVFSSLRSSAEGQGSYWQQVQHTSTMTNTHIKELLRWGWTKLDDTRRLHFLSSQLIPFLLQSLVVVQWFMHPSWNIFNYQQRGEVYYCRYVT